MGGVINTELTVHCKDVEEAHVKVKHRTWGYILHLPVERDTNVRVFLESREDFEKLFNILSWDVQVEEDLDGTDEE